jgi:hypothetical protein
VLTNLKSLQVVSNTSPFPSAPPQTVRTPFSVYRFPDRGIHSGRLSASRIPSLSDASSPVTLRQVLGFPQLGRRVRGRVLIAQEHQPLPSERSMHLSMHYALQRPVSFQHHSHNGLVTHPCQPLLLSVASCDPLSGKIPNSYGRSVTMHLAVFRRSLRSNNCLSLYVGAQFVTSLSLRAGSNESLQRK